MLRAIHKAIDARAGRKRLAIVLLSVLPSQVTEREIQREVEQIEAELQQVQTVSEIAEEEYDQMSPMEQLNYDKLRRSYLGELSFLKAKLHSNLLHPTPQEESEKAEDEKATRRKEKAIRPQQKTEVDVKKQPGSTTFVKRQIAESKAPSTKQLFASYNLQLERVIETINQILGTSKDAQSREASKVPQPLSRVMQQPSKARVLSPKVVTKQTKLRALMASDGNLIEPDYLEEAATQVRFRTIDSSRSQAEVTTTIYQALFEDLSIPVQEETISLASRNGLNLFELHEAPARHIPPKKTNFSILSIKSKEEETPETAAQVAITVPLKSESKKGTKIKGDSEAKRSTPRLDLIPSSEDHLSTQQFRWMLQPDEERKLKVQFIADRKGTYKDTLCFYLQRLPSRMESGVRRFHCLSRHSSRCESVVPKACCRPTRK